MNKHIFLSILLVASLAVTPAMAADTKISDLPAISSLAGTELFPCVQLPLVPDSTKQITAANMMPYFMTGTAAKATILATARAINGQNFDGSAAVTVPVNNANSAADADYFALFTATQGGNYAALTSTGFKYHPSTGMLTATGFTGALTGNVTGNVTGNCTGSSGTCTGNAGSASLWGAYATIAGPTQARTYTFPDAATTVVGTSATQTLTNKRINSRVTSVTTVTAGHLSPAGDTTDQYNVTALDAAAIIDTPTGTPVDGQKLLIRITSDGTIRALTWTVSAGGFRASADKPLPTATIASKTEYYNFIYNSAAGYWDYTGGLGNF